MLFLKEKELSKTEKHRVMERGSIEFSQLKGNAKLRATKLLVISSWKQFLAPYIAKGQTLPSSTTSPASLARWAISTRVVFLWAADFPQDAVVQRATSYRQFGAVDRFLRGSLFLSFSCRYAWASSHYGLRSRNG